MRNKSYGLREAYKNYQATRLPHLVVTEKEYYDIIRMVNTLLIQELVDNLEVQLPCGMGKLIIKKREVSPYMDNEKLKGLPPIDWKSTNELWKLEPETKDSIYIRYTSPSYFLVKHSKIGMQLKNGSKITFKVSRCLKDYIQALIKEGVIKDAYL